MNKSIKLILITLQLISLIFIAMDVLEFGYQSKVLSLIGYIIIFLCLIVIFTTKKKYKK